jgi:hypothetical protein
MRPHKIEATNGTETATVSITSLGTTTITVKDINYDQNIVVSYDTLIPLLLKAMQYQNQPQTIEELERSGEIA